MIKKIVSVALLLLTVATVAYAVKMKCFHCKGTGFGPNDSPFPCTFCKGTGFQDR